MSFKEKLLLSCVSCHRVLTIMNPTELYIFTTQTVFSFAISFLLNYTTVKVRTVWEGCCAFSMRELFPGTSVPRLDYFPVIWWRCFSFPCVLSISAGTKVKNERFENISFNIYALWTQTHMLRAISCGTETGKMWNLSWSVTTDNSIWRCMFDEKLCDIFMQNMKWNSV